MRATGCKCGSGERRPDAVWRCGRGHFLPKSGDDHTTLVAIPVTRELASEVLGRWLKVAAVRLQPRPDGTHELKFRTAPLPDEEPPSITSGQRRAFNAKLTTLAELTREDRLELKRQARKLAARRFGHPVETTNDLNVDEANWLLDELEQRIEAARP